MDSILLFFRFRWFLLDSIISMLVVCVLLVVMVRVSVVVSWVIRFMGEFLLGNGFYFIYCFSGDKLVLF